MPVLENGKLRVTLAEKGAELTGLKNLSNSLDYLWRGDPAVWGKHSPILFPIVGTLRKNQYRFGGKTYSLPRHGFARDQVFAISQASADRLTFQLKSNADSLLVYPFPFLLEVTYALEDATLKVSYRVQNPADKPMWFSLGAHPAFAVPLEPGQAYSDYYLEMDREENAGRWPINSEGLIQRQPVPFFNQQSRLPLQKSLFHHDALVFKNLKSERLWLRRVNGPEGWQFDFPSFPYLGLWAARDADFLCVEPWCGIADSEQASQELEEKEGIIKLDPGEEFNRWWSVTLF